MNARNAFQQGQQQHFSGTISDRTIVPLIVLCVCAISPQLNTSVTKLINRLVLPHIFSRYLTTSVVTRNVINSVRSDDNINYYFVGAIKIVVLWFCINYQNTNNIYKNWKFIKPSVISMAQKFSQAFKKALLQLGFKDLSYQ